MQVSELVLLHNDSIQEKYLDQNGHMNVMWYTHLFDKAAEALFESIGCGTSYRETQGKSPFALEQHTRYLAEMHLGDQIEISARILGRSSKRIHFILFIMNTTTNQLAATGELVGMHVDLSSRKPEPFPESVEKAIEDLLSKHRSLDWAAPVCGAMKA